MVDANRRAEQVDVLPTERERLRHAEPGQHEEADERRVVVLRLVPPAQLLRCRHHSTVVGVEAKTDEPFDDLVSVRVARSLRERAACERAGRAYTSQQLPRLDRFTRALFGSPAFDPAGDLDAEIAELPYQLLAGAAGTLIEARRRGAEQAMFVVHAFHSASLRPGRLAANDLGFARFTRLLLDEGGDVPEYGRLLGPVVPPGGDTIPSLPLWVGIAGSELPT